MTCTSPTSEPFPPPPPTKQRTTSSEGISNSEGFSDTSSPAGGSMALSEVQVSSSTSSLPTSQTQLTKPSDQVPSALSTTNNASTSWSSAEEYFSPPAAFKMTNMHELILESICKGTKWQQDLERVHGFTEAESCECFSRAGAHLYDDEFPVGVVNGKLFPHAKEGWVLLKEADRLGNAYPKELSDLSRCGALGDLLMGKDVTSSGLIGSGKASY